MGKKCKEIGCFAPKGMCAKGFYNEYPKCDYWLKDEKEEGTKVKNKEIEDSLLWSGEALEPKHISLVSIRSSPVIIGMVGTADAGKTSYLGMLFRLLFNGKKFKNWQFAGSFTLAAWEMLAQYLVIKQGGKILFPPPTPSNPDFYRLYHLTLKGENQFKDILFADSSGEVFLKWAADVNDPNAENARWIYNNSSAFVFFIDSEALITRRGEAKSEIAQMACQLAAGLGRRPVMLVWSKADKIGEVKENIKKSLTEDLEQIFGGSTVLQISNFSKSDNDPLCHTNNIQVIESLLEQLNTPASFKLEPECVLTDDLFLNYGRIHGNK